MLDTDTLKRPSCRNKLALKRSSVWLVNVGTGRRQTALCQVLGLGLPCLSVLVLNSSVPGPLRKLE